MNKEPKDRYPNGNALHEELVKIVEEMKKSAPSHSHHVVAEKKETRPVEDAPAKNPPALIQMFNNMSTLNKVLFGVLVLLVVLVVVIVFATLK